MTRGFVNVIEISFLYLISDNLLYFTVGKF